MIESWKCGWKSSRNHGRVYGGKSEGLVKMWLKIYEIMKGGVRENLKA